MKTTQQIYDSMRRQILQQAGVSVSENGELALRLQAVSHELYALYVQADWVRRQCFPQTAVGEELDHHGALRSLVRQGAARAEGTLRFTVETPAATALPIPEGTVCMTAAMGRFVTTAAGEIPTGATHADLPAQAEEPGAAGNAAAGDILLMSAPPYGVTGCVNPAPFLGGQDREEDDAFRGRILACYARLQNGANVGYYQSVALEHPEVAAATAIPCNRGANTVDVFLTAANGPASSDLVNKVSALYDERRELGIDVKVSPGVVSEFNSTVYLLMLPNQSFDAAAAKIKARVAAAFDGRYLGVVITAEMIREAIGELEGVYSCTVASPSGFRVAKSQLPRPKTVYVYSDGTVTP